MKVCLVSYEFPPNIIGGAGTYAELLVRGLKRKDVDVFVITRGEGNDRYRQIFGIPSSEAQYFRRLFFIKPALDMLDKLHKIEKFDLVHFNEPHLLLRKPRMPTVCTVHSSQVNEIRTKIANPYAGNTVADVKDLVLKSPIGSLGDIVTVHAADKIICPSAHLAGLIESYCLVDAQRICVVPNGIDVKEFDSMEESDTNILDKHDVKAGNYVLFMGRLSIFKGVQYLIQAFRNVKEKGCSNLKLVIAGSGNFEDYLRTFARGMKDIVFVGHVNSVSVKKTLYKNSFAVVVPSLYEAFPMVILEAMACAKVIIASEVGDVSCLVEHGKTGFLVKPGDAASLAKYIRILHNDQDLTESMGLCGRQLLEREYTLDRMIDRTLRIYDSM